MCQNCLQTLQSIFQLPPLSPQGHFFSSLCALWNAGMGPLGVTSIGACGFGDCSFGDCGPPRDWDTRLPPGVGLAATGVCSDSFGAFFAGLDIDKHGTELL